MKHSLSLALVTMLILMICACSNRQKKAEPQTAEPVAMEDFFKDPDKGQFRISPNGEMIIYMAPYKGRKNVFVQKLGDTIATPITEETERSVYNCFWESDDRIVYAKDKGGDENIHILSVKPDGTGLTDHTPFEGVRSGVLDILEDKPDEMLILNNKRNPQIFDVYHLDTKNDKMTMVAENPGNITGWITDHDGKIRAAITTDGVNTSLLFRETEKAPFKTVLTTNFKETLQPYLFTFDNKNLYCASNLGRDKTALVEFDPREGKELRVIYENPKVDISGLDYSRKRKTLTVINYQTDKPQKFFLDDEAKAIDEKIQAKIPGYTFLVTRKNKNEDKLLVYAYSDRYFGGYYFYDVNTDQFEKLADFMPQLKEDNMAEMKPIAYRSRDGLTIHGYLTIPKGVEAKNLPTVINPHGGPWYRDSWGFNPEVQFLANRGYAVLQMNFRGSTGYGREFWESSFKQWGRSMQDDISDGVQWLIDQGIADPQRIAIYGGSYGGYATLAGITLTPELYACAVDYVGVANMFTFMNTIPPYWEPYRKMFYEMVGDPQQDSLMLAEVSPVFHADNIQCPLLIAQGANDPRVNKDESDQMVEALRARGIPVEYIMKENEGHGFYNQENQFEFYGAMEQFFDKHLKNKGELSTEM
ncbi:S9 family peptidase [Mangrovibacterium marinum]|uniref:Dipeptidyl aminopeptidase/acylaminoacyl peptidase n=1 Tax=Mangrovibacterium marinum TaxID=1639118 RepID=A0A2T5BW12_9BACT|nr:S9 family peptidase [Mangrovibacterium marinum]PTN03798.1 dipeptidyl aminopeptidase/acylaminoacyl peptidase [Mangrovibacterium marinum]